MSESTLAPGSQVNTTTAPTQVSTVTVQTLPDPPGVSTLGDSTGYIGWGMSISYFWDEGILAQPVAAAYRSVLTEFCRRHAGAGMKVVTGVALRVGQNPAVPQPFLSGSDGNGVLMARVITIFTPPKLIDGNSVRGCFWQFVYALQSPPGQGDSLDAGCLPFDMNGPSVNTLNPNDFTQYVVSPVSSVTAPSGTSIQPVTW